MSVVTSRTRTVTHHEWLVPNPAAIGDFLEAVAFARNRYIEIHGQPSAFDDWAHITHEDDNLIIGFTTEERA
ncbi:hypothetical protein ACFO5K_04120 [Nocardia halotolerans]|uniref:Uncharacterized protein n=1 Tax=Nocardia halotolerans TaxID=1755878 RepID=A0ABV8VCQ3_9NOCA